jgi:predicted solute-binding protein
MICKSNQNMIDMLLRLKTKEDLAVDAINKIASVNVESTKKTKKIGEIAELQRLLKT